MFPIILYSFLYSSRHSVHLRIQIMPRPPRRVAALKAARTLKAQGHSQTSTPSTPSKGETAATPTAPSSAASHKRPRALGTEEQPVKKPRVTAKALARTSPPPESFRSLLPPPPESFRSSPPVSPVMQPDILPPVLSPWTSSPEQKLAPTRWHRRMDSTGRWRGEGWSSPRPYGFPKKEVQQNIG